jgi:hypothetical protein
MGGFCVPGSLLKPSHGMVACMLQRLEPNLIPPASSVDLSQGVAWQSYAWYSGEDRTRGC